MLQSVNISIQFTIVPTEILKLYILFCALRGPKIIGGYDD